MVPNAVVSYKHANSFGTVIPLPHTMSGGFGMKSGGKFKAQAELICVQHNFNSFFLICGIYVSISLHLLSFHLSSHIARIVCRYPY